MSNRFTSQEKSKFHSSLDKIGLLVSDQDRDKYVNEFIKDLKNALKGEKSSLEIFPSYVKFVDKVTQQDKFAVLQAGQVNMTKAYFDTNDDKLEIYGEMSFPMPGLGKEIGADEFFQTVITNARDVLRTNRKVGFCFSHAIESDGNGDGKLLGWARAKVKCKELEGKSIAEEFKKYLFEEFDEEYDIFVLNNATATLIAGLVESDEKEFEDFIGLIHADGYNLSYIEEVTNLEKVLKSKKKRSGQMVVNTQAGSFGGIKYSEADKGATKLLGDVAVGRFSQMVNSMVLPLVLKSVLDALAQNGDIEKKIAKGVNEIKDLDLEQMIVFLNRGLRSNTKLTSLIRVSDIDDMARLAMLIDVIIQRAAKLIAIHLAAILKYKDIGHNPVQPVGIVVSGDFLEIVRDFESRVLCELFKYFGAKDRRYVKFLYMPNATLLGTGVAAAMNL